jgi:hypothetical protein
MSAEQIYNQLESEAEQGSGNEEGSDGSAEDSEGDAPAAERDMDQPSAPVSEGGIGQVLDAPVGDEEAPTIEEQSREWKTAVSQAVTLAKQAGKVPAGIG